MRNFICSSFIHMLATQIHWNCKKPSTTVYYLVSSMKVDSRDSRVFWVNLTFKSNIRTTICIYEAITIDFWTSRHIVRTEINVNVLDFGCSRSTTCILTLSSGGSLICFPFINSYLSSAPPSMAKRWIFCMCLGIFCTQDSLYRLVD